MLVAVIVLSTVIGFVVGAGVIGVTAQRMGRERSEPVWRQEVAASYVESHLAYDAAAQLQPRDLRDLLRHHINQLQYQPHGNETKNATTTEPVAEPVTLTTHEGAIASLYAQVRADGLEVTKPVVKEVVDIHLEYLRNIGALVQSAQESSA